MRYKVFLYIVIGLFGVALTCYAAKSQRALEIHVSGTGPVIHKNILLTLENMRKKLTQPINKLEAYHFVEKGSTIIHKATAPYGYFTPQVKTDVIKSKNGWKTYFDISLQKATHISSIEVNITGPGKSNPIFTHYLANLPLKKNDILKTEKYEDIKSKLSELASSHGYFKASMEHSTITVNTYNHTAAIKITFYTGPRYRFGKVTFTKSKFHHDFLSAFLKFKSNEFYNTAQVEKTQQALVNSNQFDQVIIKPLPKKAKALRVPVHIKLIPRKSQQYTLGLGYGSDTKLRGTAGFTLRNIGNWGQRLKIMLRGSQDHNSSYLASYLIPGPNPARDLFTITANKSEINQSTGSADSTRLSVGYTLSKGYWKHTISLTYLKEFYDFARPPRIETQLIYPRISVSYLNSDHIMNPTKGISFGAQFATGLMNVNFYQITAHLNSIYTLKPTHTRFLFRTNLGYTSIKKLNQLPYSLQLFAGGPRSVRGFQFNEIGPGRNLLVLSGEIQQHIYKNWYITGFIDGGAVGDQFILSNINIGTGPGVAWVTPAGTLELSFAKAITKPKKPWSFQFTMGTVL